MSGRTVYDIRGQLRGPTYQEPLESLVPVAALVGFTVRSRLVRLSDKAHEVLDALESFSVSAGESATWPGTELVGGRTSVLHVYRLERPSLEVLVSGASDLFEWVNPSLPEDLHFMRKDGSTVLGSVAQENGAWVELDELEYVDWRATVSPHLRSIVDARE